LPCRVGWTHATNLVPRWLVLHLCGHCTVLHVHVARASCFVSHTAHIVAVVLQLYGQMNAFGGPNILSSGDNAYWRAVRQAAAPCFSMSNMKQVGKLNCSQAVMYSSQVLIMPQQLLHVSRIRLLAAARPSRPASRMCAPIPCLFW
jgi:hypothetical protein